MREATTRAIPPRARDPASPCDNGITTAAPVGSASPIAQRYHRRFRRYRDLEVADRRSAPRSHNSRSALADRRNASRLYRSQLQTGDSAQGRRSPRTAVRDGMHAPVRRRRLHPRRCAHDVDRHPRKEVKMSNQAQCRPGTTGASVTNLHRRLLLRGLEVPSMELQEDRFGPGTETAVRKIQQDLGLATAASRIGRTSATADSAPWSR